MKFLNISIILFITLCSCTKHVDKSKMNSMNYELFKGTSAEALAKAVENEDTISIRKEILGNHIPVDVKSAEYGTTLLMMATYYNSIKSAKCLLELGANPNLFNDTLKLWGENSVLIASRRSTPSSEMLQMLIDYGGDPNSQAKGVKNNNKREFIPMRDFALQVASIYSIEKVKILIHAGADINKFVDNPNTSAIFSAITHDKMDILLYLLQNGADYTMNFIQGDYSSEKTIYTKTNILDELRKLNYPLDSDNHKQKMKVVEFLANKGWNYAKSPIPDLITNWAKKEYPDTWEDYLSKY